MGELLEDAVADGRDGPRMTLDVAREGLAERMRAFRWQQVEAGFLVGLGWTMFFPQGVVAAILLQFDVPPSWFLALHVEGEAAAYLVAGAMAGDRPAARGPRDAQERAAVPPYGRLTASG